MDNKKKRVLVLHGPNLNMLGQRDPKYYGSETFDDLCAQIENRAASLGLACVNRQTNCEGELVSLVQQAHQNFDAVVLNAGAYTHYSYALRDAVEASELPFVEVHMSNIHAREDFRHRSVIAPVCVGQIAGFGKQSYFLALAYLAERLNCKML